jgi:hypothetical protein
MAFVVPLLFVQTKAALSLTKYSILMDHLTACQRFFRDRDRDRVSVTIGKALKILDGSRQSNLLQVGVTSNRRY